MCNSRYDLEDDVRHRTRCETPATRVSWITSDPGEHRRNRSERRGITRHLRVCPEQATPGSLKRVETMSSRRVIALMMLLSLWKPTLAGDLIGQASIVDGDTLEIHGTRIRLWGIDAPESSQLCRDEDSSLYRCGAWAANDLDAFIARCPVNCIPMKLDQFGRTVAACSAGSTDLGEWLVRNGLALDWLQFSKGRYQAAQLDAERAGRGIWKSSYVEPWLYRACLHANGSPASCSDDANAHP
jgi:endonuclease YncB( thermonuclease family)